MCKQQDYISSNGFAPITAWYKLKCYTGNTHSKGTLGYIDLPPGNYDGVLYWFGRNIRTNKSAISLISNLNVNHTAFSVLEEKPSRSPFSQFAETKLIIFNDSLVWLVHMLWLLVFCYPVMLILLTGLMFNLSKPSFPKANIETITHGHTWA